MVETFTHLRRVRARSGSENAHWPWSFPNPSHPSPPRFWQTPAHPPRRPIVRIHRIVNRQHLAAGAELLERRVMRQFVRQTQGCPQIRADGQQFQHTAVGRLQIRPAISGTPHQLALRLKSSPATRRPIVGQMRRSHPAASPNWPLVLSHLRPRFFHPASHSSDVLTPKKGFYKARQNQCNRTAQPKKVSLHAHTSWRGDVSLQLFDHTHR